MQGRSLRRSWIHLPGRNEGGCSLARPSAVTDSPQGRRRPSRSICPSKGATPGRSPGSRGTPPPSAGRRLRPLGNGSSNMAQRRWLSRISRWSGLIRACSGEARKNIQDDGPELIERIGRGHQHSQRRDHRPRPARPACWIVLAMVPGYPTHTATPSPPMSIPNSRALVATTIFTEPSRRPFSISRRWRGR